MTRPPPPTSAPPSPAPTSAPETLAPLDDLRLDVRQGDWTVVSERLLSWGGQHPQDFWIACLEVASAPGSEQLLASWRHANPTDPVASIVAAHRLVAQGGQQWAESQATDAAPGALDRAAETLMAAERDLMDLSAREPEVPDVWALRLISGNALGVGEAEVARRYARMVAIDPEHLGGQCIRLRQFMPPAGSDDFALACDFARSRARDTTRPDLGADALYAVLARDMWRAGQRHQVRSPPFRAELDAASDRLLQIGLSSELARIWVHSTFAFIHSMLGDRARTDAHYARAPEGVFRPTNQGMSVGDAWRMTMLLRSSDRRMRKGS